MKRYYLDYRDAEGLIVDDEGGEYPDLAAVQWQVVHWLVDRSRDPSSPQRISFRPDLAICVRDDAGPVMEMNFKYHRRREN